MLIRRCAWHREFYGYTLVHGVAAWRGFSIKFTDGVCKSCAARVRIEWRLGGHQAAPSPSGRLTGQPGRLRHAGLAVAFVLLVAMAMPIRSAFQSWLGEIPAGDPVVSPEAADVAVTVAVARHGDASASQEAMPPRVSRYRRAPRSIPRASRPRGRALDQVLTAEVAAAAPRTWFPSGAVASVEGPYPAETLLTVARAVPSAGVPAAGHRLLATEDEFARRVQRASLTRLSLSPPREWPRHAGLTVQAP